MENEDTIFPLEQAPLSNLAAAGHGFHWEGDSIDGPAIEAFVGGVFLGKGHFDRFVGRRSGDGGFGETKVTPLEGRRGDPLSLAGPVCIFNHYAHAVAAVIVRKIAENPNAGLI